MTQRLPALVVILEIEADQPRYLIEASSAEDELAVRRWLAVRPSVVASLADHLDGVLAELERDAA